MDMMRSYLTEGTEETVTGGSFGAEVETQFAREDGRPIGKDALRGIVGEDLPKVFFRPVTYDLGRQNIEIRIDPQPRMSLLVEAIREGLGWLYEKMRNVGAYPIFAPMPFLNFSGQLLLLDDPRDQIWLEIDGASALEKLARTSSFQLHVSINPGDAIEIVNSLWGVGVHEWDFPNDALWKQYIQDSEFPYNTDRYGGPEGFCDLAEYCSRLHEHNVVMHIGQVCNRPVREICPDPDLFLRSVWWHYRLRRFGATMTVEIRPIARRSDEANIQTCLEIVAQLGL
jgi:hypothetical protein